MVRVRPLDCDRDGDRLDEVWNVLRDASFSQIWPAYSISLRKKWLQCLVILLALGVRYTQRSLILAILTIPLLLLIILLLQCAAALYYFYGPPLWDIRHVFRIYCSHPDCQFWVAELTGAPHTSCRTEFVGTVAIVRKNVEDGKKVAWLRRMAVLGTHQRNGIAENLIATVVKFCKERDYDRIELITTEIQHAARKLYTKLGFTCVAYKPYKYMFGLVRIWTYELVYKLR